MADSSSIDVPWDAKAKLAALRASRPLHAPLIFSESFDQHGAEVLAHACAMGLEGILSKRRGSACRSSASADWVKRSIHVIVVESGGGRRMWPW